MRLDDVVNLLGSNRDYLILALAVLVLVEGAIIVLWARKAVRLRSELRGAVAAAEAAKGAAERAAGAVESASRARAGVRREVYSVAARTAEPPAPATAPTQPARDAVERDAVTPAASERWTAPAASPSPTPEPRWTAPAASSASAASARPVSPSSTEPLWTAPAAPSGSDAPTPAEPPADYVSPATEQAAAWILPEVAASNGNGNGHAPAPAAPEPTTLGWSDARVPVEPAADFAVVTDTTPPATPAPPAPQQPTLTVLEGTKTWSFPAAAAATPAQTPPPPPTHFDPAMFDTNDDLVDDVPPTGDILLVEDDVTIAKLYRMLLESRGYTVRHAADGLEGLDRAGEKRPDLVLLDIMMPRMNGIAFLQALRAGEMRDVPVVVLSNFMERQLVDDAMSLGALEYMVKAQTRPEALVGALPHWLRGERAFSY